MTAKLFMEEILTVGWERLCLFCLFFSALFSALLLFPAGRLAAERVLRKNRRGIAAGLPVHLIPAVWSLVLLVPAHCLFPVLGTNESALAVCFAALVLFAAASSAYPVCVRVLLEGYARTTEAEVETARTLGMSDAMIRRDLLAGRTRGKTREAYLLTLCRFFAELVPGMVAAAILMGTDSFGALCDLKQVGRNAAFLEAMLLSVGILLAAALAVFSAGRISKRRQHGT